MKCRMAIGLIAAAFAAEPASAAPPYVTDDAGVLAPGVGEVIPYFDAVFTTGHDSGEFGIDASWGIVDRLQFGVIAPLHSLDAGEDRFALGDLSLHAKIRLTGESGNGPALALGPMLAIPTNAEGRENLGLDFPLHATFALGDWEFDLGAGYRFQSDVDGGSLPFGGAVARHPLHENLGLGVEVYAEGGGASGEVLAMAGPGISWTISDRLALVAAGHAILANRAQNGDFHFYTALVVTP